MKNNFLINIPLASLTVINISCVHIKHKCPDYQEINRNDIIIENIFNFDNHIQQSIFEISITNYPDQSYKLDISPSDADSIILKKTNCPFIAVTYLNGEMRHYHAYKTEHCFELLPSGGFTTYVYSCQALLISEIIKIQLFDNHERLITTFKQKQKDDKLIIPVCPIIQLYDDKYSSWRLVFPCNNNFEKSDINKFVCFRNSGDIHWQRWYDFNGITKDISNKQLELKVVLIKDLQIVEKYYMAYCPKLP